MLRELKTGVQTKTCTHIIITALFIMVKKETTQTKQPKQNVICLYNEILFSHKKEWDTDVCYMTKTWNHCAKRSHNTKGHELYNSLYMECPK